MGFRSNQPITGRDFYFSPSGDNNLSGTSDENPVADPQTAIALINALINPPASNNPASINASVSGTYDVGVTIPQFVTCKAATASILTSDAINVECLGRHEVEWGSLLNFSAGGICVKIDGQTRVACEVNAAVPIGANGVGFSVSGVCDEVFLQLRLGDITGSGAIMFDHTAVGLTPLQYDIQSINFLDTGQTVIRYNDTVGTTETVFNIATAQRKIGGPFALAGTVIVDGIAGTLAVNANVLDAEYIAIIKSGAVLSLSAQVLAGKTKIETGGVAVYDTVGVIFGSLETMVTGSLQVRSTNIFGDVTNNGNMSIKADAVIGNITNNGSLFVNIANHVGTIINTGTMDGIINGVRFGNWIVDILDTITDETDTKLVLNSDGLGGVKWNDPLTTNRETVLNAASFVNQIPSGLDAPLQIEFGAAQGSSSTPVEIDVNGVTTINENDQFTFRVIVQYGRIAAGGASWLFFRIKNKGTQIGNPVFVKLDTANSDIPLEFIITLDLLINDLITFEFVRDSQGNDSGELMTETPTLGDWSAAPSASLLISKSRVVQPVNLIAILPGASGDYFSTPDSVASSITGDIDIQMRISATDWTPSTTETLFSKWEDTGFQKSWIFQLSSTGALRIFLSADGAVTLGPATSSAVTGFTDGTLHWVRFTWDQSSGDVDFFTSDDNTDDPTLVTWTALGVTQTLSPVSIFDSTADVEVGSHNTGTINFDGSVSRASIFNGGLVVDFDPQDYEGGSTFTSNTGEIWTLNGNVGIKDD